MHPAARILHEQVRTGLTPGLQYLHVSPDAVLFRYQGGLAQVAARAPVERTTTFSGFSVTKTLTAIAVLQLAESGVVALDRPAGVYLRDFPYPGYLSVRHLLAHTAGIPNPVPLRWTHSPAEHQGFDRNGFFAKQFAAHSRVRSAPNARFAYSNLGYQLLGQLLESVTGMSYEQFVTESILARIGVSPEELGFVLDPALHATGYHKRRSLMYPLLGLFLDRAKAFAGREEAWQAFRPSYMNGPAYGGLIGTADGFARYLQALMDPSCPLLTPASLSTLFAEHLLDGGAQSGMSLSWFVGELDGHPYRDHAGGGGGFYAELRIYPSLQRASVLLCNRTGMTNERLLDQVDRQLIQAGGMPPAVAARRAS